MTKVYGVAARARTRRARLVQFPRPVGAGGLAKLSKLAKLVAWPTAVSLAGCSYNLATHIPLVAFDMMPTKGEPVQRVEGSDCATRVFGFGRNVDSISADGAFTRARSQMPFSYLNGVSISRESKSTFMVERDCYRVAGEAFR